VSGGWPAASVHETRTVKEIPKMMTLSKRNVLGLVVGGVTLLGVAAPSALAQDSGKPGKSPAPAAAQPGKKTDEMTKAAKVGEPAPAFELKDTDGKTVKLSDYKGKIVVVDWVNPGCPVCRMHYKAGTVQNLAAKYKDKNVVFLGVNSTAAGQEGAGADANGKAKKDWKVDFPILLDESGKVGHAYGAKTTPHCFVIDSKGTLVYAGAIDDGSPAGVGKTNYVEKAMDQVLKGETVSTAETKSYGCAVHYSKGG
jgi:peroxiredoxin